MIKRIELFGVATYITPVFFETRKINFIYGANGTGKTTISNVLSNPDNFDKCRIEFSNDQDKEILIYNKSFVDMHFNENAKIKGIFTLGKDSNEAIIEIEELDKEISELDKERTEKAKTLGKKSEEQNKIRSKFETECWKFRKTYGVDFSILFKGNVKSMSTFADFCLKLDKYDSDEEYIVLRNEYKKLFENNPKILPSLVENITTFNIDKLEGFELLTQSISGNNDLQFSQLIEKMDNSDWVFEGIKHIKHSEGHCPFCQQEINNIILGNIAAYFNKAYLEKISKIEKIIINIDMHMKEIHSLVDNIKLNYVDAIDIKNVISEVEKIIIHYDKIKNIFLEKKNNLSHIYSVPDVTVISTAKIAIFDFKQQIEDWNKKVEDINNQKNILKKKILGSLESTIHKEKNEFKKEYSNISKAVYSLNLRIEEITKSKSIKLDRITVIRSEMSGISNSINEINRILKSFGFNGFLLQERDNQFYEIVRKDGTNVGKSLSEGEHRFISFLYFYQLVKGTHDQTGVKNNRIVVIDDPISSLDSNILYIVSRLTKNIIDDCLTNKNNIKQLFFLTHNVYYHKEITFRPQRSKISFKKESCLYVIVKKINEVSSIHCFDTNPIKTTYQLLWEELKNASNYEYNPSIFNSIRRILEYYFNILGGYNYEELIHKFDDEEDKQIALSLIACINDNSHDIIDDYSVIYSSDMTQKYLDIFKQVFVKLNHEHHYKMMMGELSYDTN